MSFSFSTYRLVSENKLIATLKYYLLRQNWEALIIFSILSFFFLTSRRMKSLDLYSIYILLVHIRETRAKELSLVLCERNFNFKCMFSILYIKIHMSVEL